MPRTLKLLWLLTSVLAVSFNPAAARQAPADNQDANREAIQTLAQAVASEKKKDPETWFRLGIEYNRAGDVEKARAAFKQALKLSPKFPIARAGLAYTYFVEKNYAEAEKEAYRASLVLETHGNVPDRVLATVRTQRYRDAALKALAEADQALAQNPDAPDWYRLKAEALIGLSIPEEQIPPDLSFPAKPKPPDEATLKARREEARKRDKEAADCLEKYLSLARPATKVEAYLRGQVEALRFYSQDPESAPAADRLYSSLELSSKAVITYKPEPSYTDEARDAGLIGMVRLRATLAADGKIKHLLVLMPLRYGMSEQSIKAARKIKFKPATAGGVTVSQYVILEYNFSIY